MALCLSAASRGSSSCRSQTWGSRIRYHLRNNLNRSSPPVELVLLDEVTLTAFPSFCSVVSVISVVQLRSCDRITLFFDQRDGRVSGRCAGHLATAYHGDRQYEKPGVPAAINRGLECARGEYLVILNNDAVVMDGWLEQFVDLASIRVTSESRNGTTSRMFTTEFTENTEGAEARRFRELKNEYPGREITVNDLAPESIRPRQMTLLANADPPASFYAAGVVVVGLACAVD
jgi:hypothetical protein